MRQWLELGRGQTGEHETCHVRISLLAPALVESFRMNILACIEDKKWPVDYLEHVSSFYLQSGSVLNHQCIAAFSMEVSHAAMMCLKYEVNNLF